MIEKRKLFAFNGSSILIHHLIMFLYTCCRRPLPYILCFSLYCNSCPTHYRHIFDRIKALISQSYGNDRETQDRPCHKSSNKKPSNGLEVGFEFSRFFWF